MAKTLKDLTGGKPEKPQRLPDWQRIKDGNPYSTKDLEAEHLTTLKPPMPVSSRAQAQEVAERYGVKLYPHGPYEIRCDETGQLCILHMEWERRAAMWQYQSKPETAKQFTATEDYQQRIENAYGKDE